MNLKTGQKNFRFFGEYYEIDIENDLGELLTLTITPKENQINFDLVNTETFDENQTILEVSN